MRPEAEFGSAMMLVRRGHSDAEVERRTGVPRRTVSDWRRGVGGKLSRTREDGKCRDRHDFTRLPGGDYSYLLGMYLGDGCISAAGRGVYLMRIACDAKYPAVIRECRSALEAIFPTKCARTAKRTDCSCVDVSMWSKHWPCIFPQHGAGRKHLRRIELADWQANIVDVHRKRFVRGLLHSDGTRVVATERREGRVRRAPRYVFSNRSEDIKRLFCESCDALKVHWTRPCRRQIAVYPLASVAILDEFVGPKR